MYALVPLTRRPPGSSLHRRGCGRHLERPARAAVVRTTETWQDIRCLLERQARSRPRRGTPPAGEGTGPRADRCGLRTAHGPLQRACARVTDARPSCDDGEGARGGRGRVRRPTAEGGAPKAVLRWAHGRTRHPACRQLSPLHPAGLCPGGGRIRGPCAGVRGVQSPQGSIGNRAPRSGPLPGFRFMGGTPAVGPPWLPQPHRLAGVVPQRTPESTARGGRRSVRRRTVRRGSGVCRGRRSDTALCPVTHAPCAVQAESLAPKIAAGVFHVKQRA